MGIINATPDSFSDGGRFLHTETGIEHALRLAEDGADILDIGGESTRPGADLVTLEEERARVLPIIAGLAGRTKAAISIDTRKPELAREAVAAGASIWNDVSALTFSPESLDAAAAMDCKIVLMHAQGDPKTMQDRPHYDYIVEDVYAFLAARMEACVKVGVDEARLIVDPGVGFGKTLEHNLALLANLSRLCELGRPVLLGASRKRFIGVLDRDGPADRRLGGSLAAVLEGRRQGASIFRVHDVAPTRQALKIACAIEDAIEKANSGR